MAQYFTDFGDYNVGDSFNDLAYWSSAWDAFSTAEIVGDSKYKGNRGLHLAGDMPENSGGIVGSYARWEVDTATEAEIHMRVDIDGKSNPIIFLRASTGNPRATYFVINKQTYVDNNLIIERKADSGGSVLSSVATGITGSVEMRASVDENNNFTAEVWPDGQNPSDGSSVSVTDSEFTFDTFGITNDPAYFGPGIIDWVGVGTNGDSAPTSFSEATDPPSAPNGLTLTQV